VQAGDLDAWLPESTAVFIAAVTAYRLNGAR